MPDKIYLRQMQALPLMAKVHMSQARIREWYDHWNGDVYISFSGGKDSTVLAHLVHELYPNVPMVFVNTGLEYPEVQEFAKRMGAEFVRPKMRFDEVISKYGYPIISKENAEAIHYARKIRNSPEVGGGGTQSNSLFQGRTGWRRAALTGRIPPGKDFRSEAQRTSEQQNSDGGGYNRHTQEEGQSDESAERVQRGQGKWSEWRRNCIAGVGEFTEDKPSIFNKKKWLPLCRDTQFRISHMCCSVMKKAPIKAYQKKTHLYPYIGTLADESRLREQAWIKHGCNAYEATYKTSQPMSFWKEQDVLKYLYVEGWEIASVYGDIVGVDKDGFEYEPIPGANCDLKCTGCSRTGCVFCGFGCHLEKGETRFQRLAKTHPRQYEYCLGGGQWVDNPDYDPTAPKMDGDWENWNPKQIWVPSKQGLGMKKVFDDCNAIYGKDFIRY